MQSIYPLIEQEETLYAVRKQKLIQEANKLLNTQNDDHGDIQLSIDKVAQLRQDAILMDNQVNTI